MQYTSALKLKLIYVFRINDAAHKGCLKVGETSVEYSGKSSPKTNSVLLNDAARKRIDQFTQTAGIKYELLHTEAAVYIKNSQRVPFSDADVHKVLLRSGIKKKVFDSRKKANEWFVTDLATVQKAIKAVKSGRSSLLTHEVSADDSPIVFRPEQEEAVKKTIDRFKKGNRMLWNAKMRFGKTVSALEVVKQMQFDRTIIITHRPVVDKSWFDDFGKIFHQDDKFVFGSKKMGFSLDEIPVRKKANDLRYVYFASLQDLRGSKQVGGNFVKNDKIFAQRWDCVIVDEAHEGTQTELAQAVMKKLIGKNTKLLELSGTPFNLIDMYGEEEKFTWDYVMEQKAKESWDRIHQGDPNPYSVLPKMNIFTFDLGALLGSSSTDNLAFNFSTFFSVNQKGKFVYESSIRNFLNLICRKDENTNYPFSTDEYRDTFRHTLWMLPGVKEAKALSALLKKHVVFQHYTIVNVAGDGGEEIDTGKALDSVRKAITDAPHDTYSITLSCGRLTTGVSVPAWTAVFMLSGSSSTSAANYMQTIFRVQTPAIIGGRQKEKCFVFDFAPDRTLKVVADIVKISAKAGTSAGGDRKILGEFLNFCPIIAVDGSRMLPYNVERMFEQIKKIYVERVVRSGFEDGFLYNNEELMKLNKIQLNEFEGLKKIIGSTKAMPKPKDIDINNQGFTDEEYEQTTDAGKKNRQKKELSAEEKRLLKKLEEQKKTRENAVSILRGISIRMPLLIYGADIDDDKEEITIENFANIVDTKSWREFMPKGVTKKIFKNFQKYYDPDVFRAAGKRIRSMVREADSLPIEERIARLIDIFGTFRNPDKETVLTPWRVVNMHIGDCIGGYVFYDENYEHQLPEPRLVHHGKVTDVVYSPRSRVLEINSKSGLYPLYVAYSMYRLRVERLQNEGLFSRSEPLTLKEQQDIWDSILQDNIFVICKTPMAEKITRRTLAGFRKATVNAKYVDNLVEIISKNPSLFVKKIAQGKTFWKANQDNDMKFDAIIGNPPYQVMDGGAQASATPIYNKFVEVAKQATPSYVSMIMPSRWMTGGKGLDEFRKSMIEDRHIITLHDYVDARICFDNVEIKGGICYFLRSTTDLAKCAVSFHQDDMQVLKSIRHLKFDNEDIYIRDSRLVAIKNKVSELGEISLTNIISVMKPYGIRGDFFANPEKYGLPPISKSPIKGGYTIIGLDENLKRTKRYVPADYPLPKSEGLNSYKLFIPRNYGSGKMGDTSANTVLAEPGVLCTETFLQMYPFESRKDAANCDVYIKTKLFRLLLGMRKQDQAAGRSVYQYVPLQDFSDSSDIDWSESVEEIDRQLYRKYRLTEKEISFIEKMIKPMEYRTADVVG